MLVYLHNMHPICLLLTDPILFDNFICLFCLRSATEVKHISILSMHDGVFKWKHFRRYLPFVQGNHRSPVNSPHKGQWHGALFFSLISVWINCWVHNRDAGDLRRHRAHYDVSVMCAKLSTLDKQNKQHPMILVGHPNKNYLIICLVEHHLLASGFVIRECYKNACNYPSMQSAFL